MPSLMISLYVKKLTPLAIMLTASLLLSFQISVPFAQEGVQPVEVQATTIDDEATDTIINLGGNPGKDAPFRIGMMAERGSTYLLKRIEPFRLYMEEVLLRPVEIVPFSDIRLLMAAHSAKQIDYARYPASVFAMAQAACGCLTPLAAPASLSRPDGTYMILLVNADSPFKSLGDLTGGSLALSSRKGALPYHMGLNELRLAGLDADRDIASIMVKDDPADALEMLETSEVDAALVWSATPLNQLLLTRPGAVFAYVQARKMKNKKAADPKFLTIWQTRPVPAGPHAVHNDLSKQDRANLTTALKAMNKDAPAAYDAVERVHDGGFKAVSLEDYQPLISIATAR